jgi:hypothetical protein
MEIGFPKTHYRWFSTPASYSEWLRMEISAWLNLWFFLSFQGKYRHRTSIKSKATFFDTIFELIICCVNANKWRHKL